jgi:hypothetical protein
MTLCSIVRVSPVYAELIQDNTEQEIFDMIPEIAFILRDGTLIELITSHEWWQLDFAHIYLLHAIYCSDEQGRHDAIDQFGPHNIFVQRFNTVRNIHIAIMNGHYDCVDYMINVHNIQLYGNLLRECVVAPIFSEDIIRCFRRSGVSWHPTACNDAHSIERLSIIVKHGAPLPGTILNHIQCVEMVRFLIEHNVDVKYGDIQQIVLNRHVDCVALIIEKNIKMPPMIMLFAIRSSSLDIIKLIHQAGFNFDDCCVLTASDRGNASIIKYINAML